MSQQNKSPENIVAQLRNLVMPPADEALAAKWGSTKQFTRYEIDFIYDAAALIVFLNGRVAELNKTVDGLSDKIGEREGELEHLRGVVRAQDAARIEVGLELGRAMDEMIAKVDSMLRVGI